MDEPRSFKIPESVLVVIYTPMLDVLLIERSDHPGFWQSVTGSKDFPAESFTEAAIREVFEETGINALAAQNRLTDWWLENVYDIYPEWRYRYAPGIWQNIERVFGLCIPDRQVIRLNPREHSDYAWWSWLEAADRSHSYSNAEAILMLPRLRDPAST